MPLVSIIVPVYNAEKRLKECIRSIANQEFTDFEVILVDDGSSDKSGAICDGYAKKDKRFRVIHQQNKGCVEARRTGILASEGKYICFCDADDKIPVNGLLVLVNSIQDADICVGNTVRIWNRFTIHNSYVPDCFRTNEPHIYARSEFISRLYCSWFGISNVPVNLCAKLFRREIICKAYSITASAVHFYGEDLLITLDCMPRATKICIVPEIIYFYRVGGGTSKYNPYMLEDWLSLYRYKKEYAEKYPMPQNVQRLMDIELCNMIMTYFQMLVDSEQFSEENLKSKISDVLDIQEISRAAHNSDIQEHQFSAVDLIRRKDVTAITRNILEAEKKRRRKKLIKKILYHFA